MKSEPTYPCKRMRHFRATFGDLAACSPCHSWADYTISMFEFEFRQRETFPASDAIAIAIERAPENVSARKHKKAERP
jgi:hypothetical protein